MTDANEAASTTPAAPSGPSGGGGAAPEAASVPEGPAAPGLDELRERLVDFAAARDWGRFHTPKNLAAALSVEASELLEIFQWLTPEQSTDVMTSPESAHRVRDEVADVLAYLLQFCAVLGIDPLAALSAKIDRNERRFPANPPDPAGKDDSA
ncbi:nucleotide pyrophosphohydrolase [Streptomyces sp. NPDC007088]|uniref:nucleotide pyrophosphohydrolase n=1 Tax=Streptomyces sp. NPDC007088 TaxID=3364773 RepID=UPI0036C38071